MKQVKIVRMNDGIMLVLDTEDQSFAESAKTQLMRDYYQRNKHGSCRWWETFEIYQKANVHCWRVETYQMIATLQQLDDQLNPMTRDNRQQRPETAPQPVKMPMQKQFPRIQLPAVRAASPASQDSDPTPGIPKELRKTEILDATLREEESIRAEQEQGQGKTRERNHNL